MLQSATLLEAGNRIAGFEANAAKFIGAGGYPSVLVPAYPEVYPEMGYLMDLILCIFMLCSSVLSVPFRTRNMENPVQNMIYSRMKAI